MANCMTLREMADVRCSCRNILNHFKILDRLAKLFQQKWAVFEDGPHYVAGGVLFEHTGEARACPFGGPAERL